MAGEKDYIELKAEIDAGIKVNGNKEITPPIHNAIETDIAYSSVNKKDAGNVLLALLGLAVYQAPTDDRHLTPKKYVDDLFAASSFDWADLTGSPSDNTDLIDLLDTDYYRRDGLYPLTGDMDADGNSILGLASLVLKGASIDRFTASLTVGEDVEFNTINAAFYFRRTGVDKFVIDSDMKVLLEFVAGVAGDMGISLDKGTLGDRWRMFVSDGGGAYNADESYSYHNNTSHHILTGPSGSKSFDFMENGDFINDSGDNKILDTTKGFVLPVRGGSGFIRIFFDSVLGIQTEAA